VSPTPVPTRSRPPGGGPDDDRVLSAEVEAIRVVPWPDPVIDTLGHDPRSWYVERFWLSVFGPTSTWLLRRIAAGFDVEPGGFSLDVDDAARALGLGGRRGRHSPFQRAVARCVTFEVARRGGQDLEVRRRLPPLPRRLLVRLPPSLQEHHRRWAAAQLRSPDVDERRDRARRLALGLRALDGDRSRAELQLARWHVHPAMAHEAVAWAWNLPGAGP
jgi:hypothetical protein